MSSLFSKIISGEIPSHKVYEDDLTLAFLDIYPIQPGHTLVIPKKEVDKLYDLSDEDYQAVMATAKKVARRLQEVLQPARVGYMVEGFDIPHAHVKLIPVNKGEDFDPRDTRQADDHELAQMAERLKF